MKIVKVSVYGHTLPKVGSYSMSTSTVGDPESTIVQVSTDDGWVGWGEACPAGSQYQPVHAGGIRAALQLLGPALIGVDPSKIGVVHQAMDGALNGSNEAKAAIDIACWDLIGHSLDMAVCDLIGGALMDPVLTYHVVGIGTPDESVASAGELMEAGHTKLQLKAGGRHIDHDIESTRAVAAIIRPGVDLFVDVNRGWTVEETIRFSRACRDLDFAIEQPCTTYAECAVARPLLNHPLLLDESAVDLATVARAIVEGVADGFGMKLTRIGGITGMRAVRDLCAANRTPTSCDDSWGGDIIAAACVQVGATFEPALSRGAWIAAPYISGHYDELHGPRIENGRIAIPRGPGLGLAIPDGHFGDPLAEHV